MDAMRDWLVWFVLGWVPWWAWVIAGGVLIGWAWKVFGWQGVLGGLAAAVTLGAYRKGWRDGRAGRETVATRPIDLPRPETKAPPPVKKRRTLMDILNGR
jgi:hypothetical protein